MTKQQDAPKKKSMTPMILAGIGLGILTGLFFGESVAWLGVIGDVFVGLLQMTVLPFVVVSLISNIGRFSLEEGRALARVGSLVLLLLFGVSLLALVVLPLSLPELETGAFFSAGLIEQRDPPNFFDLYIPSNPFYALAENLVPAAVLFSILLGVAMAGLERKQEVLGILDVLMKALGKVNGFIVRLTPIGVFAIAGSAAGTMTVGEFGRLQAYFAMHTFGVVLMTFLVLPLMMSVLTGIGYRKIMSHSRDFLLTAWATGSLFAVLPMLIEAIEKLLADEGWDSGDSHATPAVLVPLGYPFPTVGKLLALIFVPFVAWFLGSPLDLEQYPVFLTAGLASSFGSLVVTIPFLLELMRLPSDFFNLFLMAGVWSARLGDLAGGMHLMAFTVLTMAGLSGRLRLNLKKLVPATVVTVLVTLALVGGTRTVLANTFPGKYARTDAMDNLHKMTGEQARVLETSAPNPEPLLEEESRLGRIRRRGALRVGFQERRLPFSFINHNGELVGFDVDLVRQLASDLNVDLELVPYQPSLLSQQMADDHFDIAIGGIWGGLGLADQALFSNPYLVAHGGLLVLDHRRKDLDTLEELLLLGDELNFGVSASSFLTKAVYFPEATMTPLETEDEFFERADLDALVTTAEGGSAWTLAYPEYGVVLPIKPAPEVPLVIPVAGRDIDLREYLNVWIKFHRTRGTLGTYFDYWIKGGGLEEREPRWSIGRDVLGWW